MKPPDSYWLSTGVGPLEVKVTLDPVGGKTYMFSKYGAIIEEGMRAEDLDNKDELVTLLAKIINYAIKN